MTMPAGEYYVGDLCYVMHDRWEEFCELTTDEHDCLEGEFTLGDGTRVATFNTAWGDGAYYDEYNREYGVDAGLIGCILVKDIAEAELPRLGNGHIHKFEKDFTPFSKYGKITFATVTIDTDC